VKRPSWRAAAALTVAVLTLVVPHLLAPSWALAGSRHPQRSDRWEACTRRLDGVTTRLRADQRTVTIARQTSRTRARVSLWVRTDSACGLTRKFLTRTARIGANGTVAGTKRRQGSGTTPRGTYTMDFAFGNGSAPRHVKVAWHRVRRGDYWVGDRESRYYNQLRNRADGGFRWRLPKSNRNASENLRSFGRQYRYVMVINFNRTPDNVVPGRGFAIFVHVKRRAATAGCVGLTARQMRILLAYVHPGDSITIAR
jgi:L,D-peptidoglycan transpeptidase YkuD (ErfK/YbiS/YcfS/YnhG family)